MIMVDYGLSKEELTKLSINDGFMYCEGGSEGDLG